MAATTARGAVRDLDDALVAFAAEGCSCVEASR